MIFFLLFRQLAEIAEQLEEEKNKSSGLEKKMAAVRKYVFFIVSLEFRIIYYIISSDLNNTYLSITIQWAIKNRKTGLNCWF